MAHPAGSLDDHLLTPPGAKTLQVVYSAIAVGKGSGDEPYSHAADAECIIVLTGQLDVGVNGESHHVATGDALLLDPKLPHSYHNPGPEPTTALWVMSPPVDRPAGPLNCGFTARRAGRPRRSGSPPA